MYSFDAELNAAECIEIQAAPDAPQLARTVAILNVSGVRIMAFEGGAT